MATDKIISIVGLTNNIIALTEFGRVLSKSPKGKWTEITPSKDVLSVVDVPRFKFGKHKGQVIADADPTYVKWCNENIDGFNEPVPGEAKEPTTWLNEEKEGEDDTNEIPF